MTAEDVSVRTGHKRLAARPASSDEREASEPPYSLVRWNLPRTIVYRRSCRPSWVGKGTWSAERSEAVSLAVHLTDLHDGRPVRRSDAL